MAQTPTKAKLHTDDNVELSALRAVAVLMELSRNGIPKSAMWIEGRGSSQPRATDKASRRVEVFIGAATGKVSKP